MVASICKNYCFAEPLQLPLLRGSVAEAGCLGFQLFAVFNVLKLFFKAHLYRVSETERGSPTAGLSRKRGMFQKQGAGNAKDKCRQSCSSGTSLHWRRSSYLNIHKNRFMNGKAHLDKRAAGCHLATLCYASVQCGRPENSILRNAPCEDSIWIIKETRQGRQAGRETSGGRANEADVLVRSTSRWRGGCSRRATPQEGGCGSAAGGTGWEAVHGSG